MELTLVSETEDLLRLQAKGRLVQSVLEHSDPLRDALGSEDFSREVLLDLSEIEYIDSSGIGWLLARHKRFREAGGKLILHSASSAVLDVVRMLRLDTVFLLAEDEATAAVLARGGES
jgi:anti-sigma B factor antagonist